ncbi:MAG TPA: LLM class flavin-dependent oxidoreductase [Acidimicrobiia bacterium]|jgi:alkanesulfonate monooxygenase SsuD/methylene tetrahydromethanopterin reductase-like flavin-dependent oxidoreductase (luciferase family)
MIEIGRFGFPYRSAAITTGAALQAEADGVDAIWFADHLALAAASVPQLDGLLGAIVPDAAGFADPIVAAATTLMVTRRMTVGAILDPRRRDASTLAQSAATLAELAPGRFALGLRHGDLQDASRLDACFAAIGDLSSGSGFDVVVVGGAGAREAAARHGAGWLAEQPESAETFAETFGAGARAAVDGLAAGVMLDVIVHDDPAAAERAAAQPAVRERGLFSGTPAELVTSLKPYVDAGARRFVLENVLPLVAPEELAAADRALHAAVRNARLTFRAGAWPERPGPKAQERRA